MIIAFSGTGNSAMVARQLSQLLGDTIVTLGHDNPATLNPVHNERVVWVFPIYAWGIPKVVARYMKEVELPDHEGVHSMVCTCGDDCGLTYNLWRKIMRSRGWNYAGAYSVAMPNTYVSLPGFDVDSQEVMRRKLEAMPERVATIARNIKHGARIDDTVHGTVVFLKTRVLRPAFNALLMSPKLFHSTPACVGCAKCAAACPLANITMHEHRPVWGNVCADCLACYHACPQHAVQWGRLTRSKGQYRCPKS